MLGLGVLALLALITDNPIQKLTPWAYPIPRMLAPTCVALLAGGIVEVLASWAGPII